MNERTAQFMARLAARGLEIPEDRARERISNQVDFTAERMRIGRQAAKRYVTQDLVEKMADKTAESFRKAQTRNGLHAVPDPDRCLPKLPRPR
ncbi:Uncharacterised protein [Mycobacteroides abscessus subsp. abscessus]|nr:Uncharacterised protein [Mycobacteroides abscessus subsp. abscessus]SHQ40822.1 Uncharacterised protein [Mycobacteroides abscessus subsp. abscessus]SHQ51870.1 Uncharacterised protein [Mycobacteroides abscessus subsp. abscessus]SHQ54161.1 Uncharacterised protein [Mycobacteroides abscessus subsp. abscessus]SHR32549.1 Uncharacterised protein [Mycobacteroides abscessus subsp. abscessus]